MNNRTEKTVVTIEIFQRTVVHSRSKLKMVWCDHCAAETLMLAPVEAALLLQTTTGEIFRRIEAGKIHFLEAKSGSLLVCRGSCQPHLR